MGLFRTDEVSRRRFIQAAAVAGLAGSSGWTGAQQPTPGPAPDLTTTAERFPSLYPQLRTALEVLAEVGPAHELPDGPDGSRRVVPITGGTFRGPGLSGRVLSGGADRQRTRVDGVRELDAIYELLADDGALLMVHNQAIVDEVKPPTGEKRYVRSVVRLTAPKGPHDWLNRRLLVGTLHSLRPEKPFVFLRFHVFE